jgi:hypothetical protein
MISNMLAHFTPFEAPAGLLLFAAGLLLGFLVARALGYVRNR